MPQPSAPLLRPATGSGALPRLDLDAPDGARAEVYLHGAHVTSWRPAGAPAGDDGERLFLSRAAEFRRGAAIRGGIPVIFPQFASEGPLPKHGFARTAAWELRRTGHAAHGAWATLGLAASAATRELWPHEFDAEVTVTVGGPSLTVALAVRNTGPRALEFTGALHSYLRVTDARDARVVGLQGSRYRDSTAGGIMRADDEPALRADGEVDRVYLDAPPRLVVEEPARTTRVESTGFADAVLWNPGPRMAARLADMEPGGYRRMLCVEAAVVGTPVRLGPGELWTGTQTLTAE